MSTSLSACRFSVRVFGMSSVTVQTPFSDIGGTRNADTNFRLVSGLQPGILVFTDLA
jgi:hypothetical protein